MENLTPSKTPFRYGSCLTALCAMVGLWSSASCNRQEAAKPQPQSQTQSASSSDAPHYRGLLGGDNPKIKRDNDKTYLWANGDPDSPDAHWYDFTGSVISPDQLQFGIGQDRIPAIDDPLFVAPDDPRLLQLFPSRYRKDERPQTHDEIPIIGFVEGDEARAYPVALLDRHELVNDRIAGKPVTVGW